MRFLIFCVIPSLLIGCSISKQETFSKEARVESTGIVLKVDQTPNNAFSDLIDYFKNMGFKLEKVDKYENYLQTDFKTMGNQMYTYKIEAVIPRVDSTVIVFRGQAIGPRVQSPTRIRKKMGRLNNNLWVQFQETVVGFPHHEIYFTEN